MLDGKQDGHKGVLKKWIYPEALRISSTRSEKNEGTCGGQREQHHGGSGTLKTKKPQRRRGWCVKNSLVASNETGNMGTGWDTFYFSMIRFFPFSYYLLF